MSKFPTEGISIEAPTEESAYVVIVRVPSVAPTVKSANVVVVVIPSASPVVKSAYVVVVVFVIPFVAPVVKSAYVVIVVVPIVAPSARNWYYKSFGSSGISMTAYLTVWSSGRSSAASERGGGTSADGPLRSKDEKSR